jgi:hypothetical protein
MKGDSSGKTSGVYQGYSMSSVTARPVAAPVELAEILPASLPA